MLKGCMPNVEGVYIVFSEHVDFTGLELCKKILILLILLILLIVLKVGNAF